MAHRGRCVRTRTCYRARYQAAITRWVARRGAGLHRTQQDSTSDGNHTTTTYSSERSTPSVLADSLQEC